MNPTISQYITAYTQLITAPFSDTVLVDNATNELGYGHIFFRICKLYAIKQALGSPLAHL